MAEAISLHENPELVYMHCDVLIQIGNSDLLVTDGCGFGFSDSFANYLISQDWQWIGDLKKKGIVERAGFGQVDRNFSKDQNWKYPTVTRLFRHPEYGINSFLNKLNYSPETDHEEKEYVAVKQQIGSKLYSSVECALALVVAEYPVPEWEQVFSNQKYESNEKLLYGFATKIGLSLSPRNKKLLQVKAGAIRHIQNGRVKFQPLLAISIAGAATKYSNHPFCDLARNHSGFLDFALSLKKLRDSVSHGDISDYKKDAVQLKHDIDQTKGILQTLFPTIISELSEGDHRKNIGNDINQERFKSEIKLDEFFGLSFVYEMERGLREQLIRIEQMFAHTLDDLISIETLKALAAAMETILQQKIRNRGTVNNNVENIKEIALGKIIDAGFFDRHNEIPESITTVKSGFVDKSVRGYGTTLGASFLALMFVSSKDEIDHLYQVDEHFVTCTADLLEKRGDGNTITDPLSRDDLESLKNNVFKAIKIITEVF
jgi:hypothetical protein